MCGIARLDGHEHTCYSLPMHTLATTLTSPRSPAGSAPKPRSKSSQSLSDAYHLRIKCAQYCSRMSHASDTKRSTMEQFETLPRGWRPPDRHPTAAPGDAASSARKGRRPPPSPIPSCPCIPAPRRRGVPNGVSRASGTCGARSDRRRCCARIVFRGSPWSLR